MSLVPKKTDKAQSIHNSKSTDVTSEKKNSDEHV